MSSSTNGKPHPMRRQYYVNKAYQGRFIALLIALAVTAAAAAGVTVYRTAGAAIEDLMYRSHMPKGDLWQFILPPVFKTNLAIMALCFLAAALMVALMLRKTNRSLRAIEEDMRALGTRDIRHDGTAKPLGIDVHALVGESIARKTAFLKHAANDLLRIAAQGQEQVHLETPAVTPPVEDQIEDIIERIEAGCAQFQGSPVSDSEQQAP